MKKLSALSTWARREPPLSGACDDAPDVSGAEACDDAVPCCAGAAAAKPSPTPRAANPRAPVIALVAVNFLMVFISVAFLVVCPACLPDLPLKLWLRHEPGHRANDVFAETG